MSDVPLSGFEQQDLRSLIDARCVDRPNHPFLIWDPFDGKPSEWSYSEFRDVLRCFGAGLRQRGVAPGDRVLVHLTNSPQAMIAWLGCCYAGAVAVSTNTSSTLEELGYYVAHSGARCAITQPRFAAVLRAAAPDLEFIAVTDGEVGVAPIAHLPHGCIGFREIDDAGAGPPELPHDPWAPFGIQYTSGTTARPKAVIWTHANALWGARLSAMHESLREDDRHLVHLPLFHTNAQVYSVLASLWVGATVVLTPRFSTSQFWPVSLRHRCTWTSLVPFCIRTLDALPVPDEHYYRCWGNAVCDPPAAGRYRVPIIGWWGMTETVSHGIVGSPHGGNAPNSLGRASPGYGIIIRGEDGRPCRPGETGDLFVRGRRGVSLFQEYAGDVGATSAVFVEEDMIATGDRVRLGEDGSLFFADRDKDMLKVGGENVAASEVERVIASVPGVNEVAVVAQRHAMLDEVPVAFVIASAAAGPLHVAIAAACERGLATFKRPREIRFVETLPRSTLEKVAKAQLRALLAAEQTAGEPSP